MFTTDAKIANALANDPEFAAKVTTLLRSMIDHPCRASIADLLLGCVADVRALESCGSISLSKPQSRLRLAR